VQPLCQNAPYHICLRFKFYQTGCGRFSEDILLSLPFFPGASFLSTQAAKEKKQKNAAWLMLDFILPRVEKAI